MILVQKILFLKNVPLFESMPPTELSHLANIATEIIYDAGETVITQGELGESLYLIVEGQVEVLQDGKQIAKLGENEYFGEMSILDGEPRSATVKAITECFVLSLNKENFYMILSRHNEVALHIIRTLTQRLRNSSSS